MRFTEERIAIIEGDTILSEEIIAAKGLVLPRVSTTLGWLADRIPAGGVVADIGACLGIYSCVLAPMVGSKGRVHAFEANPAVLPALRFNMRPYPQVLVHGYGLADRAQTAHPLIDPNQPDNVGMTTLGKGGDVTLKTLDSVAKYWSRLDFVKLDVEGMEEGVLLGGAAVIAKYRPTILVEINKYALNNHKSTPEAVLALLASWNYGFTPIRDLDSLSQTMVERMSAPEFDVICSPQELCQSTEEFPYLTLELVPLP